MANFQNHKKKQTKILDYIFAFNRKEEEESALAKAKSLEMPYVDLLGFPLEESVLEIIPPEYVKNYNLIAYKKEGKEVSLATTNPEDPNLKNAIRELTQATGYHFQLALASGNSIRYGKQIYELKISSQISPPLVPSEFKLEKFSTFLEVKEKIKNLPITEIVETILGGAISLGASDVHVKPEEGKLRIRYRIDGLLQDVIFLPKEAINPVISRIKFLAKMKLDISKKPQDGKISLIFEGRKIDIRVASIPTLYGEQLSLRILDKEGRFFSLETLGFQAEDYKILESYINRPEGMILVCGPTGSGKTTTLYAILEKLNKPSLNILTLEDPIEYTLEGISQTQVDEEASYDFKSGLRSILRTDPDVLMIGEIRDNKTAEIAIHSALTGHIVLSTFHTNNAPTAILRLSDLGIKPILLVSALKLIISQRLVRKICEDCKEEYLPTTEEVKEIQKYFPQFTKEDKLFLGRGCNLCNYTGYKGRTGIFEILKITPKIKEAFMEKTSLEEIKKIAEKEGFLYLIKDGLKKVLGGITTLEEVMRQGAEE